MNSDNFEDQTSDAIIEDEVTPKSQTAEEKAESQSSPCRSKRCIVKYAAMVVIALVVLWLIFTRGNDMIAEPFVDSQLQHIAQNIESQAALSGDIASLTYDDITVTGGLFNKKAIIHNLKLDYLANLPFGNQQHMVISTSEAVVTADQISDDVIVIKFPKPFMIDRKQQPAFEMTFEGTPTYRFLSQNAKEEHNVELPSKFVLRLNPGSEDPVDVTGTYADGAIFKRRVDLEKQFQETVFELSDIKLSSNVESNEILVAGIQAKTSETQLAAGQRRFETKAVINDVVIKQASQTQGPYSLKVDLNGDYQVAQANADQPVFVEDINVNIEAFNLSTDEYSVAANGYVSREPDDQMLFGKANVTINGLDKFLKSPLIGVNDEVLVSKVVQQITGNGDLERAETSFSISREKQGTFYLGNTSFENLIGVIVTHAISQQEAQKNKALPENGEVPVPDVQLPAESDQNTTEGDAAPAQPAPALAPDHSAPEQVSPPVSESSSNSAGQ